MDNNSLSNLSTKELGSKSTTGKKLIGSIHSGMAVNQERKDTEAFQQYWDAYFKHQGEIISSEKNADKFIAELSTLSLTNNVIKAKCCFLIALCYYLTQRYIQSNEYIEQALRLNNNSEYYLFKNLILDKNENKDIHEIVSNSVILLNDLQNNMIDKSFYELELRNSIQEETKQYKQAALKKAKSYFFKRSLICVPLFLYIYYKYSIYVALEGWFSFSWNPIYIFLMFIIACYYLPKVISFISTINRDNVKWEEMMRKEYINN